MGMYGLSKRAGKIEPQAERVSQFEESQFLRKYQTCWYSSAREHPQMFSRTLELVLHDKAEMKKTLDAFYTGGVTTLKFVDFPCPAPPATAFKVLTNVNKWLRNVSITMWDLREVEEDIILEKVAEIVESFFQCPALEILQISDMFGYRPSERIDSIDEIVRGKYRHRRVDVSIFFYDYSWK